MQAYSRARCHPYKPPSTNAGKLMRYWFSYVEWGKMDDVDVRCTDPELNAAGHQKFEDMFDKMRHSVFCPAFPGDAASTRRLSEIFLAGCIPVFLGPPYHSMPFSETVLSHTMPPSLCYWLRNETCVGSEPLRGGRELHDVDMLVAWV